MSLNIIISLYNIIIVITLNVWKYNHGNNVI